MRDQSGVSLDRRRQSPELVKSLCDEIGMWRDRAEKAEAQLRTLAEAIQRASYRAKVHNVGEMPWDVIMTEQDWTEIARQADAALRASRPALSLEGR